MYAAANTILFVRNGSYEQFKGMFAGESQGNATEELFQALSQSITDTAQHSTNHFTIMSNGDVWMYHFAPTTNNKWNITNIVLLDEEQGDMIKSLLN